MDALSIISGLTVASVSGLAIGAGARLIPTAWQLAQIDRQFQKEPAANSKRLDHLPFPRRTREGSVVGIFRDLLRHVDGSYTRGYEVPLQTTMLATHEVFEDLIDDFAYMLADNLPVGT